MVRAVVSARSGCSSTASRVKNTVAPSHRPAWIRVRNHGTRSAVILSSSVGSRSSITQRSARSAPAVPHTAPTDTATPT